MNLSTELRVNRNGSTNRDISKTESRFGSEPAPADSGVRTELAQAESRIEALRLLVLTFLREVDSLKRVVASRPRAKRESVNLDKEVEAFEASLIREALLRSNGNQRDAARELRIGPSTLNAKMKRLGISVGTTVTSVD